MEHRIQLQLPPHPHLALAEAEHRLLSLLPLLLADLILVRLMQLLQLHQVSDKLSTIFLVEDSVLYTQIYYMYV